MKTVRLLTLTLALGLFLAGTALAAKDQFEMEVDKEKATTIFVLKKTAPAEPEMLEAAKVLASQVEKGGYKIMTVEDLKKLMDAKKDMVIIDTMPIDAFNKEHIPGAKQFLFPIPDMNEWDTKETAGMSKDDFTKMLGPDKNKTLVFYCGFVKCTRSHNGAVWAKKLGYTDVWRVPGGIFAWKGAKYPVESSK